MKDKEVIGVKKGLFKNKKPIEIELKYPVTWGSEIIDKITLQPIKAKHMRGLPITDELEWDSILDLTAKLAGQPPSMLDEIDFEDIQSIAEVLGDFFGPGRETGKKE